MAFQPSVFTVVLLFAATIAGSIAAVAWRRAAPGGRAFAVLMAGIAVWCFGDAVQYGVTTMPAYRVAAAVATTGTLVAPTAALVFVLQYAGYDRWVTRRTVALLAVSPATTFALLLTNRLHHLLWRYTGPKRLQPVTTVPIDAGPWFTVYLAYNYAVVAAALGVLGMLYLRSEDVYRRQAALMIGGTVVPLSLNLLWLVDASPIEGVDLSSLTFLLTGVAFAVALYNYDLLDLAPVASHTMVSELRDGVVAVDHQGRIADTNPVARRLLGDGVVGEPAAEVVPNYESVVEDYRESDSGPAGGPAGRRANGEADADRTDPDEGGSGGADGPRRNAGDDRTEDVVLDVDGERRHFEVSTSPLSEAGRKAGHTLLLRDVTERRRVEQRYQSLVEKASDLHVVVEPDGTSRYVSPSIETVLGYERAAIEGTNALEYVHPDDREAVAEKLASIAEEAGAALRAEFRVRTPDGDYRVLEARGRNLLDDPAVEGIVVNARDVTRRKRRERALRRQNEQLEEFAAVISHDLRNPMAVARGYAGVLEEEYDDPRVSKVVDAHERMDELLEDLLTLAREGRTVDETEPVDLDEVARMAWATVDTKEATLAVPAEVTVLADESRLRQLLENLFRNSVEHGGESVSVVVGELHDAGAASGAGSGAVDRGDGERTGDTGADERTGGLDGERTGDTGADERTGDTGADERTGEQAAGRSDGGTGPTGFYVADDGPGIPEEKRDSVFDAGTTSQDDGTGFGLTIVRRIAEAHGWSVGVEEGAAGGARFVFADVDVPE